MFTGIVEELGTVSAIEHGADSAVLRIRGPLVVSDAVHGASIAVNGVCLTVTRARQRAVRRRRHGRDPEPQRPRGAASRATASTSSGRCAPTVVSAGTSCRATSTARPRSRGARPGTAGRQSISRSHADLAAYVVEKGSITVDGVSLTVASVGDDRFSVSLIPTTLALTTLGHKGVGDVVNLEVDVIAKYVERLLGARAAVQR